MSYQIYKKRLFEHGGSRAVDLPKEANFENQDVIVEVRDEGVFIYSDPLTNMESDPQFHFFIEALLQNALENPSELKNLEEVWDEEWDELLNL